MTSLILGRYWSREAGEGSSPNAVSRQFRKSSGTCASSLVETKNRCGGRNRDHISICAVADIIFIVAVAVIAIIIELVNERKLFLVPCVDTNFVESLAGQVELSGKLDKDVRNLFLADLPVGPKGQGLEELFGGNQQLRDSGLNRIHL